MLPLSSSFRRLVLSFHKSCPLAGEFAGGKSFAGKHPERGAPELTSKPESVKRRCNDVQ
jgi:hypothetical protein